jgi:hypothetical protein
VEIGFFFWQKARVGSILAAIGAPSLDGGSVLELDMAISKAFKSILPKMRRLAQR